MFRAIKDFLGQWAYETEATLKVFGELTDASLAQKVTEDGRSLGRIAWHIAQTIPEMGGKTGLELAGPAEDAPVPTSARDVRDAFEAAATSLGTAVESSWDDETLEQEDDMYGQRWPRSNTLAILVHHQAHHRGQMTVLMRQAGLKVPGVYGPSREEWTDYGMPAQE